MCLVTRKNLVSAKVISPWWPPSPSSDVPTRLPATGGLHHGRWE
jgi:hypothetical protein